MCCEGVSYCVLFNVIGVLALGNVAVSRCNDLKCLMLFMFSSQRKGLTSELKLNRLLSGGDKVDICIQQIELLNFPS